MKYFFTTPALKLISFCCLVALVTETQAQETGISPYSRLGIGDLNKGYSPGYSTMGGASVSLSDFNMLNSANPASYSKMLQHMPVFELDGASQFLNLKSE